MSSYKDTKTGLWYCQFYYTDWKGQRRHTCKRNFARKKDADLYERQFKAKEQRETITMSALIDSYIEYMRTLVKMGSIEHSTFISKESCINYYIRDYFGNAPAEGVNMDVVNAWISTLAKRRIKNQPKKREFLASRTINLVRSILSQIFDYAIKTHRITDNPVKYAVHAQTRTNDTRAKLWTIEQYKEFHSHIESEERRVLYNIMFWTGMRIGEILALTPNDILPYNISVTKTWIDGNHAEGKPFTKPKPKNKYSIRSVEIPRELYFQTQDYISKQYGLKPNDRIFEDSASAIRNQLTYWSRKLGLPKISPHILRHSYASLLFNVTGDLMLVSSQLGHSNVITTGKIYTHQVPGANRAGVDKLEQTAVLPAIDRG